MNLLKSIHKWNSFCHDRKWTLGIINNNKKKRFWLNDDLKKCVEANTIIQLAFYFLLEFITEMCFFFRISLTCLKIWISNYELQIFRSKFFENYSQVFYDKILTRRIGFCLLVYNCFSFLFLYTNTSSGTRRHEANLIIIKKSLTKFL